MDLNAWAKKWQISENAINDLKKQMGIGNEPAGVEIAELSESAVLSKIRLEACIKGARLWRNNVGGTYTKEGNFLRFGLANDSARLNRTLKSADLIGIKPVLITQEMVGTIIGQFLSREIKATGWRYSANDREQAQLRWIELILSLGGDAAFATDEGTL